MKVLISICEGYCLSETSRVIYSPGFERPDIGKSEHECLCEISRLIEARLIQEGVQVLARRYDDPRYAEFMFDKARHAYGCDAAILIALNNSQNPNAQFATTMVHMIQDENSRTLFEGVMASLSRYMPIQSRYPNQMRKAPFLENCKKKGVPAAIILPFFYTNKDLDAEKLGQYIEASAKAISEAVLAFNPKY
jgi:N-acetylmuramoyl-L-alanine amidase